MTSALSTNETVAAALAIYRALDQGYPSMGEDERRTLKHGLFDHLPWKHLVYGLPTIQKMVGPSTLEKLTQERGGFSTALVGPLLLWSLHQPWAADAPKMTERILSKWGHTHLDSDYLLKDVSMRDHLHLMRSTHLLLDTSKQTLPPEAFAHMLKHASLISARLVYGPGGNIHDAQGHPHVSKPELVQWLQWVTKTFERSKGCVAFADGAMHDSCILWKSIAVNIIRERRVSPATRSRPPSMFEHVLHSTIPIKTRLEMLSFATPETWALPFIAPAMHRVLPPNLEERIAIVPWDSDSRPNHTVRDTNKALASAFLARLYPAMAIVYPDDVWNDKQSLTEALLVTARAQVPQSSSAALAAPLDMGLLF